MLGHLSADKSTACARAPIRNPLHNLGHMLGAKFANGDVIQKEQGLSAKRHNIVDTHSHKVLANGLMAVKELR
jgi:hypothetical protein